MTGAVLRPLDIGQVMLLLTLGAWLLRGLARREIRLPVVPLLWPLVIFVGWAAISLLWAPSVEYAALEVIKWAEIILIMLMVTEAAGKQRLGWVMAGVLVSGTFQAALGIWQHRSARHRPGDIQDRRASVSRLWFVRAAQSLRGLPRPDLAGGSGIAHRSNSKFQISAQPASTRNIKSPRHLASCTLASCLRLASCYLSWRSCSPGRAERGWARWRPWW